MPVSTSYQLTRPPWIVDWENTPRDTGAQIDWASVDPDRVDNAGKKYVPDGTIMAMIASTGKYIPRADVDISPAPGDQLGTETAAGILIGQANEGDRTDALTGYGLLLGGVVYDNLLADHENASFEAWVDELVANGTHFIYRTHVNSIAD